MPSLPDAGDHHPTVLMITALVALARREHTGGPKWIRVLIAALVLVAGLGSLPRLGDYFPGQLFVWDSSLALGKGEPAWAPYGSALA